MRHSRLAIHGLRFALLAVALTFSGRIFAADPSTDFNTANEFYAKGKFAEAATVYEKLISSGAVSANVLFNYGNAEFKAGNPGKAIAAFRKAELIAPRDAEIRANLAFVRNQVQAGTATGSRLNEWLGQLTVNEWIMLATVFFWLTLFLLAAKQLRPGLRPKLKNIVYLSAALAVLTASAATFRTMDHFSRQTAVVVQPQTTAFTGPFDDAQTSFSVHGGAELPVLDRHGNWVQVADRTGKIGWVPAGQVEVLPDA